jgi:hypothetical protein
VFGENISQKTPFGDSSSSKYSVQYSKKKILGFPKNYRLKRVDYFFMPLICVCLDIV